MAPIFLPNTRATQCSDEAGILITKTVLPKYIPGPYTPDLLPDHLKCPEELCYVPSLSYFSIKSLIPHVDSINLGGCPRIRYHPEVHMGMLKGFIDFFHTETRKQDMIYVDPRVWGVFIQTYASLPDCFETYTLPLSDTHLTTLQGIQSTADFTLLTVLDLSSQPEMSDETMVALKPLVNLSVLDLSGTQVGSWGVQQLSMCLVEGKKSGPWGLRVWSLRGCRRLDDSVKSHLAKFLLLSVIDLRDTSVKTSSAIQGFKSNPSFEYDKLYHPFAPLEWIPALCELFPQSRIFEADPSNSHPHVLHIDRLHHPAHAPVRRLSSLLGNTPNAQTVGDEARVAALLPSGKQTLHNGFALAHPELILDMARRKREKEERISGRTRGEWLYEDRWPLRSDHEDDYIALNDFGHMEDDETDYSDDEDGRYNHHRDESEEDFERDTHVLWPVESESDFHELFEDVNHEEIKVRNQVAALVRERDAGARQAQMFYGQSLWDHRLDRKGSHPAHNARSHEAVRPSFPECRNPELMFIRTPPSFEANSQGKTGTQNKKRKSDNEVISVKKRNLSSNLNDSLWARKRPGHATQPETRVALDTVNGVQPRDLSPLGARRAPEGHGNSAHPPMVQVSVNPFLAKRKVLSQRANPSTLTPIDSPSMPPTASASVPPGKLDATTRKPRSTTQPTTTGRAIKGRTEPPEETRQQSGAAKKSRGFDMMAWATQRKKP